jgi:glycine cleavage system H lipoate-binding protein
MLKKKKKGATVKGFQVPENECIWMKAGVVNFHICDMAYDCFDCKFDKAMTKAMSNKGAEAKTWTDSMKDKFDGASRPCRHVITGRIQQPKICTHNYECHDCAYDQMLDNIEVSEIRQAPEYLDVSGFDVAQDYYYHSGHTWVRVEHGGMARIGFDDFIMRLFGKARLGRDLPGIGSRMNKGKVGWSITQDNHEASVLAPVTGTLLAVNQRVKENPEIMHNDPYQDGWLYIVEPKSPKKDLKDLSFGQASIGWIEQENNRLMQLMGPEYQKLAATGGEPVRDFFGFNPEIGWDKLVKTFLGT